jgi:outer membrane receptor protein involved in Fe transport
MHRSFSADTQWMRSQHWSLRYIAKLSAIAGILLACLPALAQTAQFQGQVTDPQKAVVAGADVHIVNLATGVEHAVKTNREGLYVAPFILPGTYKITVQALGFSNASSEPLTVTVGQTLAFDVRLSLGKASDQIVVNGASLLLNTVNASVSTTIDQQFVEDLPLNGRSFQALLALAPGIVQMAGGEQFSVNGQRTDENYFTVDGISANAGAGSLPGGAGASAANFSSLGTTHSILSVDAMQEFQINTSTYSAEYGRQPGGQFSLVSRSGTNAWHGSAFDYLRNAVMDANNWFNNLHSVARQNEHQNDFGGTLGGPVRVPHFYDGRDKTFFFFNYEAIKLEQPQAAIAVQLPDATLFKFAPAVLLPFLNSMPKLDPKLDTTVGDFTAYSSWQADPNAGVGTEYVGFPTWSTLNTSGLRLDHTVNTRVKVFARYLRSPSGAEGYCNNCTTPPSEWITPINRTNTATLGVTTSITRSIDNDLRLGMNQVNWQQHYQNTTYDGAVPPDYASIIPGYVPNETSVSLYFWWPSTGFGNYNYPSANAQRQVNIVDSTSWTVHNHFIKFGVDWRRQATWETNTVLGMFGGYTKEADFISNTLDTFYARLSPYTDFKPEFANTGLYIQDEWKLTSRLNLSIGVRWDVDPALSMENYYPWTVNEVTNFSTMTLAPQGTPLWQTQWTKFAPRIGAAYRLRDGDSGTVVRAGIGLFNDNPNEEATTSNLGLNNLKYYDVTHADAASFPLTKQQVSYCVAPNTNCIPAIVNPYPANASNPLASSITGFDPNLKAPISLEWNAAVEHAFGAKQSLKVTYVGAASQRLLKVDIFSPSKLFANPNFTSASTATLFVNGHRSIYNALQVEFQRRLSRGLEVLASYTYSHSIDNASSNGNYMGNEYQTDLPYASSDFDIRHNFHLAGTYELPGKHTNPLLSNVLDRWNLDTIVSARTALPLNVDVQGGFTDGAGNSVTYNPSLVAGQPLYLATCSTACAGGRQLNWAAFAEAKNASGTVINGTLGRNALRGFNLVQPDVAMHKQFALSERTKLEFRAEAFNFINHPDFMAPCYSNNVSNCTWNPTATAAAQKTWGVSNETFNNQSPNYMQPMYELGGPRSLQVALKLKF